MAKTGNALLAAKVRELGSQTEVARRTGVSNSIISRIINEGARVTVDTALDFRDVLGIPVDAWRSRRRRSGGPRRPPVASPQSGTDTDGQAALWARRRCGLLMCPSLRRPGWSRQ